MTQSYIPQWATDLSTCLGIISFFLTYFVFNQVKSIKTQFLYKARLPQLNEELGLTSNNLVKLLRGNDVELDLIAIELSKCAGIIENIIKKLDRDSRESPKNLLKKLRTKQRFTGRVKHIKLDNTDQVWEIYKELVFLNKNLIEIIKDSNWK